VRPAPRQWRRSVAVEIGNFGRLSVNHDASPLCHDVERWSVLVAKLDGPGVDHPAPEGVQRQDGYVAGAIAKLAGHLTAESASGFGGEADDQDARGIEAALINGVRPTFAER